MEQYHGINCPICGKPLEDGREIAVCPECGAPYHKECIQQRGSCCYPELHRLHETWKPEGHTGAQGSAQSGETFRCPNCGTENPVNGVFCVHCGAPLLSDAARQYRQQQGGYSGGSPFGQAPGGGYGYQGSPYNQPGQGPNMGGGFGPGGGPAPGFGPNANGFSPFVDADLNAEEKLEDIAVTDYALFVGQNTHYFLPRFKMFAKGKKVLPNFAVFFFSGFYFLYRKMILWGILLLCMDFLLYVPSLMYVVDAVQFSMVQDETALMFNLDVVSNMSMIASMIGIVMNVLLCLFTNRLYYAFAKKKINEVKEKEPDISRHSQLIQKRGGVLRVLIPILLVAYFAIYIGMQYLVLNLAG